MAVLLYLALCTKYPTALPGCLSITGTKYRKLSSPKTSLSLCVSNRIHNATDISPMRSSLSLSETMAEWHLSMSKVTMHQSYTNDFAYNSEKVFSQLFEFTVDNE